jgi:glutamine amidotransferase
VGMQIMAKSSEEGQTPGFGWIDATVKLLDSSKLATKPYLPHLGWNQSIPVNEHPLFMGINEERGFYFLHSYYMDCKSSNDIISYTFYGESFCSVVQHENIYGIQFHPEKSHENGLLILKNFANL